MTASTPLLRELLRTHRRPLVLSLIGAVGFLLTMLAQPLVIRHGVQGLIDERHRPVLEASVVAVLLGVIRAGFGAMRKYQAAQLMTSAGVDLRARVNAHLLRLDLGQHARFGSGQLLARSSGDVTLIEQFLGTGPFLIQSVLIGVGGAALLFVLSPALAIIVVALVIVSGALALMLGRPMYPTSTALQELAGEYASFVEEQVHGIRVIKGHGFGATNRELGGALADAVRKLGVGLGRQRARFIAGFLAVPALATLAVLTVGGQMARRGELSAADLLAFLQYLGLLITPLLVSAELLSVWPRARAAVRRVTAVIEAVPAVRDPSTPVPLPVRPPALELRSVSFGYRAGVPVLHDVDLEVAAGSTTAVVGASGSGKSTLLHLIERFADPWTGSVRLGGTDIRELALSELRLQLCCVFQHPALFATTVRDNVLLGQAGATAQQVDRALERACCASVVDALVHGADTEVGEKGAQLSGGERQRVSLARGLLRQAPVMLLDDVSSALDPTTAAQVHRMIAEEVQGRTVLLVAQHLDAVRLADTAVVIDRGRIVARGTPAEMEHHPAFRLALALDAGVLSGARR